MLTSSVFVIFELTELLLFLSGASLNSGKKSDRCDASNALLEAKAFFVFKLFLRLTTKFTYSV